MIIFIFRRRKKKKKHRKTLLANLIEMLKRKKRTMKTKIFEIKKNTFHPN